MKLRALVAILTIFFSGLVFVSFVDSHSSVTVDSALNAAHSIPCKSFSISGARTRQSSFIAVRCPGNPSVICLEALFVGRSPDRCALAVLRENSRDIFFEGGRDFLPMPATVGRQQDSSRFSDYPANLF
jgi:hypothetical protein